MLDDLPAGDVTVKGQYSSINYKDGARLCGAVRGRTFVSL